MSSLLGNSNDTVGISETTRKIKSSYGVASDSVFLQDYQQSINILLKDSIKSKWDTYTLDPPASKILFSEVWFTQSKDIEIVVLNGFTDKPQVRGSVTTDRRMQKVIQNVDIHIGVRSRGGDVEPPVLNKVINALDEIISLNKRTLVDNLVCEVVSVQQGPTERSESRQTFWHKLMKVRTFYWKVQTV